MKVCLIFVIVYVILVFSGGEVPATKLAALQKVLQSDFLSAVREVYEHVYETVDIQVFYIQMLVTTHCSI